MRAKPSANRVKWLKNQTTRLSIYLGLQPFVIVANICGIFTLKYDDNRFKVGGVMRRFYAVIIFGIRFAIRCQTFVSPITIAKTKESDAIIAVIYYMSIAGMFLATTSDFLITAFHDNRLVEFFDKLVVYDKAVAKLRHPHQDRYSTYWIVLSITCIFIYLVLDKKLEAQTEIAWNVVYFLSQVLLYRMSILRFDLLTHLIYQRFRHLNRSILPSVSWTRNFSPQNLNVVTPKDVLFLHATLLDASIIIRDTFSVMILCSMFSLFFTAIIDIYFPSSDKIILLVSVFALIVITCGVCHHTAEEGNNTIKYMTKDEPILIEDSTAMERVRVQLYFLHNPVMFTAGEFFVVSLPIIYSMLISSIIYGTLLLKSDNKPWWNDTRL